MDALPAPAVDERRLIAASVAASVALHAAALAVAPAFRHADEVEPPRVLSVVLVQPPAEEEKPQAVQPPSPPPQAKRPVPRGPPTPVRETREERRATAPPPADAGPRPDRTAFAPAPSADAGAPAAAPAAPPAPAVAAAPREPQSPPDFQAGYLRNPPPAYPAAARRNGEEGTVTLRVLVSADGAPREVALERSSGSSALDAAALATVRTWRFVPARRGAEALDAWVLVPVVFRLEPRG
jgi:protein TonB